MKIRIGYRLAFDVPQPTPMILMLNVHYTRAADLHWPDHIMSVPSVPMTGYRDNFGNWCTRVVAPPGRITFTTETIVNDTGLHDAVVPNAMQHPVQDLPEEALMYLLGSRYCETDRLVEMAWALFGQGPTGWARVQAICDYAHRRIRFDYQKARPTKTAWDAYMEQEGVCRDYAHLAVALCRCMNIPARYCTGYLGDIGVPPVDAPMDFAGWFEAYLGGQWYTFDARNNVPRIGRVLMGRGRDATDVALSTVFGPNTLAEFSVTTDEVVG